LLCLKIEFITEAIFTKNTNITIKLSWNLFTKVIKTKRRSLGLFRQRV